MSKKFNFVFVFLILLMAISMVSAVKPITSVTTTDKGLIIEPTNKDYIQTGQNHSFEIHVFNQSDGYPVTSGLTCYMHLYHNGGEHGFIGVTQTSDHIFDYGFDLFGGNFTERGEYQAKYQCNNSVAMVGGGAEVYFWVNDYGEELTPAKASSFNFSMIFMMILFLCALIGLFTIENYIGKFALYWVCHILFIVGTFSLWQFNQGYALAYFGLIGFWKVLFYVSTIAVFPMVLLSIAWIVYIHTFNEHFEKLIDKGEDPETAFKMAKRKKGWYNGN